MAPQALEMWARTENPTPEKGDLTLPQALEGKLPQ